MTDTLSQKIQAAQTELDPQFKALRAVMAALRNAGKLAHEDSGEALAMQKAMLKLQLVAPEVESEALDEAVTAFSATTQKALESLAFDFARELKEAFEERGQSVEGRPPSLIIAPLILNININTRKAQWFYGREALTRPIPLSLQGILKAFDRQQKAIGQRTLKADAFIAELHQAWSDCMAERSRRPQGDRIPLVEVFSKLTLNRQANRFWNAPSRSTFKDYLRPHFVRDLVLLGQSNSTFEADGKTVEFRLGVATKSQADSAAKSIWLPKGGLDGDHFSDITFKDM